MWFKGTFCRTGWGGRGVYRYVVLAGLMSLVLVQPQSVFPVGFDRDGQSMVLLSSAGVAKGVGSGFGTVVSPDGMRVAFVENLDGRPVIHVQRISGGERKWDLETLPKGRVRDLSWSPDSTSLAFEHDFDEEGRTLYVWKLRDDKANGLFNVTDHAEAMSPTFSGDGLGAFLLWKGVVRRINLGNGSMSSLPMDQILTGVPHGSMIASLCSVPGAGDDFVFSVEFADRAVKPALFVFRAADKQSYRLTPVKVGARRPRLSPNPRMVVFEGEFEDGFWLGSVSLGGGEAAKLVKTEK